MSIASPGSLSILFYIDCFDIYKHTNTKFIQFPAIRRSINSAKRHAGLFFHGTILIFFTHINLKVVEFLTLMMVITLLITIGVEVPIDNQLKTWTVPGLPANWESLRHRWDIFHSARTFTPIASVGLFAWGMANRQ